MSDPSNSGEGALARAASAAAGSLAAAAAAGSAAAAEDVAQAAAASVSAASAAAQAPASLPLTHEAHAVLFDVDYTLLRPSELFEASGYRRMGLRFGLDLDEQRWDEAEVAAYKAVKARRRQIGNTHDDAVYEIIAEAVIGAMGGDDRETVRACAEAVIDEWGRCDNFSLYDDVKPCLSRLRAAGLKIGLVSNTNRNLADVLEHFALNEFVDAAVTSVEVGEMKPSPLIFATALAALGEPAVNVIMVGDSLEDDVRGALACGLSAVLIDRGGRAPSVTGQAKILSLAELPALLQLA